MTSFKYLICSVLVLCLIALTFTGCGSQRYTTKFMATPMDSVNEDLPINAQKLTTELDDEMRREDEKRRKELLDKVKEDKERLAAEKGDKASLQNTEEAK